MKFVYNLNLFFSLTPRLLLGVLFFHFIACGTAAELSNETTSTISTGRQSSLVTDPTLLTEKNFEFLGAFRLPESGGITSRFGYGGETMAFNPEGDPSGDSDGFPGSLYILGHDQEQLVAEVSIPTPQLFETDISKLNTAKFLQPFGDITGGLRATLNTGNGSKVRGLAWFKDEKMGPKIYWTAIQYYNVSGSNDLSHGVSGLNINTPNAQGLWRLGDVHSQMTAGYIFSVPEYFATENLGGKQLISGLNVAQGVSFSSAGPAMFAYSPSQETNLGMGAKLDVTPLVYYEHVYPESSPFPDYQIPDGWNGGAWVNTANAHTILITGTRAMGPTFYGLSRLGDCSPDKGYHGDPYEPRILFYNPKDLAAVTRGEKKPWEVLPYLEWNPSAFMAPTCDGLLFDAEYDVENQLLYILHKNADRTGMEPYPLIYVFQVI